MGGSEARSGFEYQDLATGYYFLKLGGVQEVLIEKKADFTCLIRQSDTSQNYYFQARSHESGNLTWGEFKRELVPSVSTLLEKHAENQKNDEEEHFPRFGFITNCSLNGTLKKIYSDVQKYQEGKLDWIFFEKKHSKKIRKLESATDLSKVQLKILFSGLEISQKTKDGLEEGCKSYLKDCQFGRYTEAYNTILEEIRDTNEGRITRSEIEDKIEFTLKKRSESSITKNVEGVKDEIEKIHERYKQESKRPPSKISEEKKIVESYFDEKEREAEDEREEIRLNSSRESLVQNFERLDEVEQKKSEISNSIKSDLERFVEDEEES